MIRVISTSFIALALGSLGLLHTTQPGASFASAVRHPLYAQSTLGSASVEEMSQNWAGLVKLGSSDTAVSATWATPTAYNATPNPQSAVAQWVGLGGYQSQSLIQVGTITTPNAAGDPVTTVFWENLPAAATTGMTVPEGTTVTATITPDGADQWTLSLTDGGTAPLVNQVVTLTPREASAVESSADWITEAPTSTRGVVPLSPIASTTMQHLTANGAPLSQLTSSSLQTIGLQDSGETALPTVDISADSLTVTVSGTSRSGLGGSGYPGGGYGRTHWTPWSGHQRGGYGRYWGRY